MYETVRIAGVGRQIGVIRIAVGEMAEGREDEIPIVSSHRADDVTRSAGHGVEALHEREVAVACGAEQGLKIGLGEGGDARARSPASEMVSASQPSV